MYPSGVAVSVGGNEHRRVQLGKALGRRRCAVVLATARPDRPYGGGQKSDDGFGRVGNIPDYPLTRLDSQPPQLGRNSGHLGAQLRPRQVARPLLL
jgi:hypothetical protein